MAHSASTREPVRGTVSEPSVGTLVKSALADVSVLIRNEVELAKSELGRSAKKVGISVGLFVVAGVLLALAGIYFFVFVAELIARQLTGAYKVKHPAMKPLYEDAISALARDFDGRWRIRSVPRAQNARADALVNEALDGLR